MLVCLSFNSSRKAANRSKATKAMTMECQLTQQLSYKTNPSDQTNVHVNTFNLHGHVHVHVQHVHVNVMPVCVRSVRQRVSKERNSALHGVIRITTTKWGGKVNTTQNSLLVYQCNARLQGLAALSLCPRPIFEKTFWTHIALAGHKQGCTGRNINLAAGIHPGLNIYSAVFGMP